MNKLNEAIETIQDMLDVAKKTGSAYVYTHNGGDDRIRNVLDQLQAYKEQLGKLEKELEQLQKEKEALVADLKKLEETGEMCILCSHCCAGGKPIYQQSDDYLEYCTSCDEGYSNFEWRGAPDEKTDSGLLEE